MAYRVGLVEVRRKHGREVIEVDVWRGPMDVAHVRIDLAKLWRLVKRSEKNARRCCRRGPLTVRRPAWSRTRLV